MSGEGGCERRIEGFVKIQKKKIWGGGSGRGVSGRGRVGVGGQWEGSGWGGGSGWM